MVKNENFITLQGWMVNTLGLKGNELIVFALIYGFSQDQESEFQGSYEYIANWLKSSRQTAITIINKLYNKGYIVKTESCKKGKTNFYQYNKELIDELIAASQKTLLVKKFDQSKNLTTTSQKTLLDQSKNLTTTSQKTLLNNNKDKDINNNNIHLNTTIQEPKFDPFKEI